MAQVALDAAIKIKKKYNIEVGVCHFSTIKPLDKIMLKKIIKKSEKVVPIEENVKEGGFGSSILEFMSSLNQSKKCDVRIFGLRSSFSKKYGTQQEILHDNNLQDDYLSKKMYRFILNDRF